MFCAMQVIMIAAGNEVVVYLICRCNTSLLIDYSPRNGEHKYILIDVGKTFREQVLRWFTRYRIPCVDSVSSKAYFSFGFTVSILLYW